MAAGKYVNNVNSTATEDVDNAFNRVKSVTCNGSDLTDFVIDDHNCYLGAMNSPDTPIFKMGIDILLTPVETTPDTTTKKTKLINPLAVLMKEVQLELRYLELTEKDVDKEPEVDEQILAKLYGLFMEMEVGYYNNDQEEKLIKNAGHLKNTLCFVQKYWKVLIRAEYPHIPTGDYKSSMLLNAITDLERTKKKKERIESKKIASHIKTLTNLDWREFWGKAFKDTIGCSKDEIGIVIEVLQRHHDSLGADAKSKFFAKSNPGPTVKSVPAAFRKLTTAVKISDTEFHSIVDSAFKKKKKSPGKPSPFAACVNISVLSLADTLRGMVDYEALYLTDEVMGIDKFGEAIGKPFLTASDRARYRAMFRDQLAAGVENMRIHFYGKVYPGENPDCIFVWKVPVVRGPQHDGKVTLTIDSCREMAPKKMQREAVKHYNMIMNNITDLPAGACDALRNYLFMGEPNPDGTIADEYVELVMDMAAGEPIDVSALPDGRVKNSRGGKGIGATQYAEFWKACREVLLPDSATEERRAKDIIYASAAHSIPNLVKLAN